MTKEKTKSISYSELAKCVGDCILNNNIRTAFNTDYDDWELINGKTEYCYTHENEKDCEKNDYIDCNHESYDIYQDYIITQSGAEYLQRVSNEIVFYNEKLEMYVWCITHFGTAWNGVYTTIKEI